MNNSCDRLFQAASWGLACLCASSTLSTKAAGAAWLWLTLMGIGAYLANARFRHHVQTQPVVWMWFMVCLVALALKTLPMFYWQDPWAERHGEIRVMVGAFGALGLLLNQTTRKHLNTASSTAAAIACCVAAWVAWHAPTRDHLPTHPIPWAVGVSLLTLVPLHRSLLGTDRVPIRVWNGIATFAGMTAVLWSESRGAFGLFAWGMLIGLLGLRRHVSKKMTVGAFLAACLVLIVWVSSPLADHTRARLAITWSEFQLTQTDKANRFDTSVGARLAMWNNSATAVADAPIIGHGRDARVEMVKAWGSTAYGTFVSTLAHVHNQFLNDTLDHGLFGLASGLTYVMGLVAISLHLLRRQHTQAGWTMAGIAFIHTTASLSNVNFAHNYYPTVLSLVVTLTLLSVAEKSPMSNELKHTG